MKKKWLFVILIILQLGFAIIFGNAKKSYFGDEIFSYGLANSMDYSFISRSSSRSYSKNHGWVDANYYKHYLEVSKQDAFKYKAPYVNQENDVHPPLYYFLLHTICSFFPGQFSKWFGLGLNLGILVLIDLLLYDIAKYILKDEFKAVLTVGMFSCCAAGLSNITLIRMYLLLTMDILAVVDLHLHIWKEGFTKSKYLLVLLSVVMGGLTHYYFYIFMFIYGLPWVIYLFIKNRPACFKYVGSLLGGFVINLLIFPATLNHVFGGYRGVQVVNNLQKQQRNLFSVYYPWTNNSIFGGMLVYFFCVVAVVIIYRYIERKGTFIKRDHIPYSLLLYSFASALWGAVVIKGSQMAQPRYIYPLYPWLALVIVYLLSFVIETFSKYAHLNEVIMTALVVFLCASSIIRYGIDCQYPEYPNVEAQVEKLKGADCLLYSQNSWVDYYTALPLKLNYDESYFFNANEIKNLNKILRYRKTKNQVVVLLPDSMSKTDVKKTMKAIIGHTSFRSYSNVYNYYTQAYLLK